MTHLRVAVDIGGTFTDICVFDERSSELRVAKTPSTANPIEAVLTGIKLADVELDDVSLFSHGTTVATNALITRRFKPSAMVTTKGFRDVIEIRRGTKQDLWDTYKDVAPPYIRRRDRLEVVERIDHSGRVVAELDEAEARKVAAVLAKRGVEAVAVCFINSYANPAHERRMAEILRESLPEAHISTSSDVLPEIFEHERFSTTVANAVVAPLVTGYVNNLADALKERGYRGDLLLLHSGGGVMTPRGVQELPVRLAASGLAAGAIACRHLAGLAGYRNAIGLDMGGTSTDISLVVDGELRTSSEWAVEYGQPICLPSVEVLTIGAGGGSIAKVDDGGSLRNGPESAGSLPGPAAYGRGGKLATNTDANVVLGRLGTTLAGGEMRLSAKLSAEVIDTAVSEPLGLRTTDAAAAILTVANANMADAVRLVGIQRGYDPRDFALVAFGGAGPLHSVDLARELSIPTVVVPPNPGISSALGCLLIDIRHDLSKMVLADLASTTVEDLEQAFVELEAEARERLAHEGVAENHMTLQRSVDMRYRGQWRSLKVDVTAPLGDLAGLAERFHTEHGNAHSFRRDDAPIEVYRVSITALGTTPKPELASSEPRAGDPKPVDRRPVYFDGAWVNDCPVYDRAEFHSGDRFAGPAIVDQLDSTTVVPPGATVTVDRWHNMIIAVGEQS
ncbi:hydantoinase/oxoprolinase family protein [Nocardia sp. NPDC059246]|uniref:hydantoinase/oxoprolinase family protein n=1 Tax=unclassified Nocardia TaxID=2637762 RepID=UPI0036AF586E